MAYDPEKDYRQALETELAQVKDFAEWLSNQKPVSRPWEQHPKVFVLTNNGSLTAPGNIAVLMRRLVEVFGDQLRAAQVSSLLGTATILDDIQHGVLREKS